MALGRSEGAGRFLIHRADSVSAATGANWHPAIAKIRAQGRNGRRGRGGAFSVGGPELFGVVNRAQIADAYIRLRGCAGADESRRRHRGEQCNHGDDHHQLNQSERTGGA